MFHAVAYWRVTNRDAEGWPSAFKHLPAAQTMQNDDGTYRSGDDDRIPSRDVLLIESVNNIFTLRLTTYATGNHHLVAMTLDKPIGKHTIQHPQRAYHTRQHTRTK